MNGAGDPFDLEQVLLDTEFPTQDLPPYGLLLKEILLGDPTFSIRGDEAEELWRIVEPVLKAWAEDEVPLEEYPAGSSGPSGAPPTPHTSTGAQESSPAGDDPRSG